MASLENIDIQLAGFNIEDEENEELIFDDDGVEDSNKFNLCLVGRFLKEKSLNTRAMKSKLVDYLEACEGYQYKRPKGWCRFVSFLS